MTNQSSIRAMVRGTYDMQVLRIQMGNRIVANYRSRLGLSPGQKEEDDKEAEKVLKKMRESYDKMMDGIKGRRLTLAKFTGDELISDYTELSLMEQYVGMEEREKIQFRMLGDAIKSFPIWTEYLSKVKGIGPAIAGILISEIDIHRAEYPTSLWRLAGLDVGEDGRGRSRRREHLTKYKYIDKNGNEKVREGITFNPFLKTKLMGVAAPSFLKQADSSYRKLYLEYRTRLENTHIHQTHYKVTTTDGKYARFTNLSVPCADVDKLKDYMAKFWSGEKQYTSSDITVANRFYIIATKDGLRSEEFDNNSIPQHKDWVELAKTFSDRWNESADNIEVRVIGKTRAHRHMMSQRYAIKMFLQDLYQVWRKLEGLPVSPTYAESKLGLKHGSAEGKQQFHDNQEKSNITTRNGAAPA